jgi:hypothetical protein
MVGKSRDDLVFTDMRGAPELELAGSGVSGCGGEVPEFR